MADPLSLFLVAMSALFLTATTQDSCELYGLDPSSCTDGFPSKSHIDQVARNFDLDTQDRRQVVIPAINFSCNGTITRWIIGARWRGNTNAYTELQMWRKNSEDQYMKVDGTTINVNENSSEIYEVATSLSFQSGDVLGYFQPLYIYSELDLYLEDSGRITTYHRSLSDSELTPPAIGAIFTGTNTDDRYPLIAVRTDTQGCACGFMSAERVYDLLKESDREDYSNRQLIFPSIRFTCDGELVKWIMAGRWRNNNRVQFPQLQIWRSSTDDNMIFEKHNSSDIYFPEKEDDEVYEFLVSPPLPVQSGDILGVWQPRSYESRLRVGYDADGDSVYYATGSNVNNNEFDINGGGVTTSTDIPLVTALLIIIASETEVSTFYPSSVINMTSSWRTVNIHTSSLTNSVNIVNNNTTTGISKVVSLSLYDTQLLLSSTIRATITTNSSVTISGTDTEERRAVVGISVGVALPVVVLISLTAFIISVTLCLRRRRKKKLITSENVSYHSSNAQFTMTKTSTEQYDYVSTHRPHPPHNTEGVAISNNEAYGKLEREMEENVAYGVNEVELSDNMAYTSTTAGGGGTEDGENYIYL